MYCTDSWLSSVERRQSLLETLKRRRSVLERNGMGTCSQLKIKILPHYAVTLAKQNKVKVICLFPVEIPEKEASRFLFFLRCTMMNVIGNCNSDYFKYILKTKRNNSHKRIPLETLANIFWSWLPSRHESLVALRMIRVIARWSEEEPFDWMSGSGLAF